MQKLSNAPDSIYGRSAPVGKDSHGNNAPKASRSESDGAAPELEPRSCLTSSSSDWLAAAGNSVQTYLFAAVPIDARVNQA